MRKRPVSNQNGQRVSPAERVRKRFYEKVRMAGADECWLWMAQYNDKGYGRFKLAGLQVYAHRVAVVLARGRIPKGMMVHHTCHSRKCVNPKHLRVVTYTYNNRETHWWGGEPKALDLPGMGGMNAND